MGIEWATLAAIGSIVGGGAAVMNAMGSKPDKPQAPQVEKPPQTAKAPDAGMVRQKNANAALGPGGGPGTTFLTGTGGVDPSMLNLGKSTLLGQ